MKKELDYSITITSEKGQPHNKIVINNNEEFVDFTVNGWIQTGYQMLDEICNDKIDLCNLLGYWQIHLTKIMQDLREKYGTKLPEEKQTKKSE